MNENLLIPQEFTFTNTISDNNKYIGLFATIMNLLNSVLGAGVLSISNSFTFCGIIPSILILTLSAILSYISSILIIKLQFIYNVKTLPDLALLSLGKFGSLILAFSTIIFCYSCMTA